MKIKTKKQLNLPQLIEWAWDNNVKGRMFLTESDYCVGFDRHGFIYFNSINSMPLDQTFTVEVEQEITEDTVFKELICLDVDDKYNSYDNVCVLDFDDDRVRAIYIPNSDLTMTLIWCDGRMIE